MRFYFLILLSILGLGTLVLAGPHPRRDVSTCSQKFKEIVSNEIKDEFGKSIPVKNVSNQTIIVDTNFLIALGQMNSQTAQRHHAETVQHLAEYLRKLRGKGAGSPELSTTKITTYETAYRDEKIPSGVSIVKVSQYKQADYDHVLAQLKKANVGGANIDSLNAQNDRKIIADVLFAEKKSTDVVPKFATRDSGIVIPLCRLNPQCLAIFKNSSSAEARDLITPANYHLIREKFPNGFSLSISDSNNFSRNISILPL